MAVATKKILNLRIDPKLKSKAEAVTEDIGLSMTAAITLFLKALVRENGLPFQVTANGEIVHKSRQIPVVRKQTVIVPKKKQKAKTSDDDFNFDNLTSLKNAIRKL